MPAVDKAISELRSKGIDDASIIDALSKLLDPETAWSIHAELSLRFFNEGLQMVDKGDVVQASEKLYKAVEEAVKALAIRSNLSEAKEAMEGGRWTVSPLDEASWKLGDDVERAWVEAYFLHVNGFHEIRIGIDEVRKRINVIKKLIDSLRQ